MRALFAFPLRIGAMNVGTMLAHRLVADEEVRAGCASPALIRLRAHAYSQDRWTVALLIVCR